MRLFIALKLPTDVRDELAAVQQRLRHTEAHPVKWVAPQSIHLTLQFLGEVPEAQLPAILQALEAVRTTAAQRSPLRLAEAGAFPNLRRPQTLWVGIAGELEGLTRLHQAVIAATEPLGFQLETRPFRAHLTLGRVRREATPAQRVALGTALGSLSPPRSVTWQSGHPLLFRSTLTPTGSIYTELGPA
jgi:RNA 2',3'-cyclic 3'-phosphodiesterase